MAKKSGKSKSQLKASLLREVLKGVSKRTGKSKSSINKSLSRSARAKISGGGIGVKLSQRSGGLPGRRRR